MRIKHRLQQEDGFTLIELMAVLAILTMLVLIAVPAIGSITKKAEAQTDDATISMIEKAGGLALLGDVAYDDPEEEQYEVATLVEEGYLDIDDGHKYAGSGNAVTHIKGYEFEFNGDGVVDEPSEGNPSTPEAPGEELPAPEIPIVFSGLSSAAYDGNPNTYHRGSGTLTWTGDLTGKTLRIKGAPQGGNYLYARFYDINGNVIWTSNPFKGYVETSQTVTVPVGAVKLLFSAQNMNPTIDIAVLN